MRRLEIDPDDADNHFGLAMAYYQKGFVYGLAELVWGYSIIIDSISIGINKIKPGSACLINRAALCSRLLPHVKNKLRLGIIMWLSESIAFHLNVIK